MAKKGPKIAGFWPWGAEFCENQKRLGHSLTFTPERLYTKFQKIWLIRLGENALQTDERTNERTDGTEIIGPSRKIPGTKNQIYTFQISKGTKSFNILARGTSSQRGILIVRGVCVSVCLFVCLCVCLSQILSPGKI